MKTLIKMNNEKYTVTDTPEEFLLEMLLKRKREKGDYPTVEELMKDKAMPTQGTYAYYFKTYDNACLEADSFARKSEERPRSVLREKYKKYFASAH